MLVEGGFIMVAIKHIPKVDGETVTRIQVALDADQSTSPFGKRTIMSIRVVNCTDEQ